MQIIFMLSALDTSIDNCYRDWRTTTQAFFNVKKFELRLLFMLVLNSESKINVILQHHQSRGKLQLLP